MSRHVTFMTIDDAEHYTPERRAEIIASYPAHEREARAKGIPVLGSAGCSRSPKKTSPSRRSRSRSTGSQINGLDFGWDHPFGATNCAWDKDADVLLRLQGILGSEQTPLIHAGPIKPWGDWIPCAWPHDGLQHDKGSGEELAKQYKTHGLRCCPSARRSRTAATASRPASSTCWSGCRPDAGRCSRPAAAGSASSGSITARTA
jgi:hypothetical protein